MILYDGRHLTGDNLEELHAQAEALRIPRYFFQDCYIPHYSAYISRYRQKRTNSTTPSLIRKYLSLTKGAYTPELPIVWRQEIHDNPWSWARREENF